MNCSACHKPLPLGKAWCPSCKCWNLPDTGNSEDEETVLLSDARLLEISRIETGLVDYVFGGGIARTSVNLIAGPPGAGKTTLFLQLADIIACQFGREILYVANEQEADEIKTTACRIQVNALNKIRIVRAMGGLRRDLGEIILQFNPCAIIIDSLTKLVADDLELAVKVVERLKDYTVKLKAPGFVVNQINKEGDHAGLQKLQHAVDALFMLDLERDGTRYLYSTKNRFGESPRGTELEMSGADAMIPGKLFWKADDLPNKEDLTGTS